METPSRMSILFLSLTVTKTSLLAVNIIYAEIETMKDVPGDIRFHKAM